MAHSIQIYNALSDTEVQRNKLNESAQLKNASIKGINLSDAEKSRIAEASRGFESMFVNIMFKEMKKGLLDKEDDEKNDSLSVFGADTFEGYTDMMFSDEISKSGKGIGIAEMIYSHLTGGDSLKPITMEVPDNIPEVKVEPSILKAPIESNPIKESKPTIFGDSFIDRLNSRISKYENIINEASSIYKVPKNVIKAIIGAESAGRADAVSSAGAKGLMQLMDGTADNLGVRNSFDVKQNIFGGTKYIKLMLDKFDGNIEYALAAYNAGPGNVMKYSGIPPFKETQSYVVRVKKYMKILNNEI
ncbi:MAG: transglycosylase SLT domain-containing protein [Bacteroidetes bacterium]|nr:transglycosylase SLT domain-containing protein [Bacteroidota bacterium]